MASGCRHVRPRQRSRWRWHKAAAAMNTLAAPGFRSAKITGRLLLLSTVPARERRGEPAAGKGALLWIHELGRRANTADAMLRAQPNQTNFNRFTEAVTELARTAEQANCWLMAQRVWRALAEGQRRWAERAAMKRARAAQQTRRSIARTARPHGNARRRRCSTATRTTARAGFAKKKRRPRRSSEPPLAAGTTPSAPSARLRSARLRSVSAFVCAWWPPRLGVEGATRYARAMNLRAAPQPPRDRRRGGNV
jgi:hypothetical protein